MNYKLFYICLSITRIKSFVIFAYVLVSEINWEYAGIEQMLHPAYSLGLALLLLLNFVPTHGSLPVIMMLQQTRRGGIFCEEVLHLKGQELISVCGSKNWQKGSFGWCNTIASTLNAKLLLF